MPEISVIIPSYNCADFLSESVNSVFTQSFADLEIIVVDDGSTDNTSEVMSQYESDPRIRFIQQQNRGLPAARNAGVAESRGEYIAALDADDALEPTALEEMLAATRNAHASWCIIDILKFWENYTEIQRTQLPADGLKFGILREDFIRRAMFLNKSALERVGLWDPEMKMREDWDLNIRLIRAGEKHVYLPRPLYRYRKRPGSITTGDPKRLLAYTEQLLRKHHKQLADAGDPAIGEIYAEHMWDLARQHFYRRKDLLRTSACLKESLRYDFRLSRIFHPIAHNLSTSRLRTD